jgi:DMSO reductase anchor subunit
MPHSIELAITIIWKNFMWANFISILQKANLLEQEHNFIPKIAIPGFAVAVTCDIGLAGDADTDTCQSSVVRSFWSRLILDTASQGTEPMISFG